MEDRMTNEDFEKIPNDEIFASGTNTIVARRMGYKMITWIATKHDNRWQIKYIPEAVSFADVYKTGIVLDRLNYVNMLVPANSDIAFLYTAKQ